MSRGITYIVVTRNPHSKKLLAIMDEDDSLCEFETEVAAFEAATKIDICRAWGAEILPLAGPIPA